MILTRVFIETGGTDKSVPYEQTDVFVIFRSWLIVGTGGTDKSVPYEQFDILYLISYSAMPRVSVIWFRSNRSSVDTPCSCMVTP